MRDSIDYDSYSRQYRSGNHSPSVYEYIKQQAGKLLGTKLCMLGGRQYCMDSSCCGDDMGFNTDTGKCELSGDGDEVAGADGFTTIEKSLTVVL